MTAEPEVPLIEGLKKTPPGPAQTHKSHLTEVVLLHKKHHPQPGNADKAKDFFVGGQHSIDLKGFHAAQGILQGDQGAVHIDGHVVYALPLELILYPGK